MAQNIFGAVLGGFVKTSDFASDIVDMSDGVVSATIELYLALCKEMLPTPSKSHYTFNLRDVSKVVQGLLQIRPAKCADADAFSRLWCHEACRVFCDRCDPHKVASRPTPIIK